MSSNNYAQPEHSTKIQVLDGLRKHKVFHIEITPADDLWWGKGGQNIDDLEYGTSSIDIHHAEVLFEIASNMDGVNFGGGYHGFWFQIDKYYFWLLPVTKEDLLTARQRESLHWQPAKPAAPKEEQ